MTGTRPNDVCQRAWPGLLGFWLVGLVVTLAGAFISVPEAAVAADEGRSETRVSETGVRAGKSASLKVVVIKALNGRAAVRVRGNGGYSKRVSASQVLKVPAGRYRIEAESVRTRSWSSKPVLSARKVTLAPGKKKTVRVSYWDTVSSQVRVPGKTDTLRFEAPGVSDSGLLRSKTRYRRGTILASGPSKAAPYGFLVEVEEVTGGSGAFVHQVRQADLTEALPRGDFSVDEAVDF
ncbi:MAG: hypothetical protein ACKOL0_06450, partial [Solirubrobacterales bacterium]